MVDTPITVVGNLVRDPEVRFTPSGAAVANFTIASTPRTFDRQTNEWKDGESLFLNCSVWRQTAENVSDSLAKGMRVIVTGKLKARSYEDRDGNRRTVHEIEVDEVGPSLRYATAQVTRSQSNNWQSDYSQPQQGYAPQQNSWSSQGNAPSDNRSMGSDPWADAQSGEPPY